MSETRPRWHAVADRLNDDVRVVLWHDSELTRWPLSGDDAEAFALGVMAAVVAARDAAGSPVEGNARAADSSKEDT
jgi:hypothetical protein